MRLQGVMGLEHKYEDAYMRYKDKTSGSHGVGTLL